jgi:metal-responsive CopG/Arc/MetJ family transcriptional regulator
MRKERADVRVEPELLEELDAIAQRKGQSRSEAIRDAIACFVDEEKDGWNSTGLKVNIPNRLADKVDMAIMNSDATDIDNVIKQALDFWTRDIEDYHLNRKPKMEKITAENVRKDSANAQMRESSKLLARK